MAKSIIMATLFGLIFTLGLLAFNAESRVVRKAEAKNSEIVKIFN